MKAFLVQISKCLAIILYWGLVAGISYLFYHEYLIEHKWTNICYMVAFLSLGLAAHGLFIQHIYKIEIDNFATEHRELYPKIEKIVSNASFIFMALFMLSFLVALIGPIVLLYGIGVFIVIRSTWVCWSLVSSVLMGSILLRIPRKSLFLGNLSKILYRISLWGYTVLIVYCEILIFTVLIEENPIIEDEMIAAAIFLLLVFAGVSYLLFKNSKKGIFSFASMRYVLLLRAFEDDNICKTIYLRLKDTIRIPVRLVGNPSEGDTWFNIEYTDEYTETDRHWLPSGNWKYFLRFYIAKAKVVVMLAGSTDGIIWEALENSERLNKCVICYTSALQLQDFKNRLQTLQDSNHQPLICAISKILAKNPTFNAFVVQKDKVYVDNVEVLTEQVLKNDLKAASCIIDLDLGIANSDQSLWKRITYRVFRSLHILNYINTIEAVRNVFVRGVISTMAAIVAIGFYLAVIALGICLILYPIYIWTMPDYDSYSIGMKIFETSFSIGCGWYILESVFSKDK